MSRIEAAILTDDSRLVGVLQRYWEQDEGGKFPHRTGGLAAELEVHPLALTALVRERTRAVVPDWKCTKCAAPTPVSSRSDYQQKSSTWKWAQRSGQGIVCDGCQLEARQEKQARDSAKQNTMREKVRARYSARELLTLDPNYYSLRDIVYLLAFVRLAGSESLEWLHPVESLTGRLAPTEAYTNLLVKHLHHHELAAVHPGSDLLAFEWNADEPDRFYTRKVHWTVGANSEEAKTFVRRTETALQATCWPLSWLTQLPEFLEELLVEECLQYLEQSLEEHHLPFTPGEKTKLVFASVLKDYPLGDIYNMIWRQTKDAAAFYQRGGVTQQHAANTIPSGIQRFADRARAEGWKLKRFSRNPRIPQSAVSQVLFDTALKLGDRLYSLSLRDVEALAQPHLQIATEFVEAMRSCLSEPRHPGRTMIHELLVQLPMRSPTLDELSKLTEDVTMGEMEWDDYVLAAETLLDDPTLPRYM